MPKESQKASSWVTTNVVFNCSSYRKSVFSSPWETFQTATTKYNRTRSNNILTYWSYQHIIYHCSCLANSASNCWVWWSARLRALWICIRRRVASLYFKRSSALMRFRYSLARLAASQRFCSEVFWLCDGLHPLTKSPKPWTGRRITDLSSQGPRARFCCFLLVTCSTAKDNQKNSSAAPATTVSPNCILVYFVLLIKRSSSPVILPLLKFFRNYTECLIYCKRHFVHSSLWSVILTKPIKCLNTNVCLHSHSNARPQSGHSKWKEKSIIFTEERQLPIHAFNIWALYNLMNECSLFLSDPSAYMALTV